MDITQWSASEVRQALEAEGFETDICDTFLGRLNMFSQIMKFEYFNVTVF
jgi:hypothetical protein